MYPISEIPAISAARNGLYQLPRFLSVNVGDVRWPHVDTKFLVDLDKPGDATRLLLLTAQYNCLVQACGQNGQQVIRPTAAHTFAEVRAWGHNLMAVGIVSSKKELTALIEEGKPS